MPIIFPITYNCNLNCSYCSEKRTEAVDIEKGLILILASKEEWVYITGGEPLLVPELQSVCMRLREKGKKIGLCTNGTIHDFHILDYIDRIGVSIDGNETLTDGNRGKGTYKKAVEFLETAVTYPNLETVIMCTVLERNIMQEAHLEALGKRLGVTYFQETMCRKY